MHSWTSFCKGRENVHSPEHSWLENLCVPCTQWKARISRDSRTSMGRSSPSRGVRLGETPSVRSRGAKGCKARAVVLLQFRNVPQTRVLRHCHVAEFGRWDPVKQVDHWRHGAGILTPALSSVFASLTLWGEHSTVTLSHHTAKATGENDHGLNLCIHESKQTFPSLVLVCLGYLVTVMKSR